MTNSRDRVQNIVIFIVASSFITICFLPVITSGDVAPRPIPPSGLGSAGENNYTTYLKYVNVTMDLYGDISRGYGKFILYNPSNQPENITLFFDPGYEPKNCTIHVDGVDVDTWVDEIEVTTERPYIPGDRYSVILFNVSSNPHSEHTVSISWETNSSKTYYYSKTYVDESSVPHYYRLYQRTEWVMYYLIISRSGWNEPIEEVNVTFDIHSVEFYNYTQHMTSKEYDDPYFSRIVTNKTDGFNVVSYRLRDVWCEDILLKIGDPDHTSRITKYYYPEFNHTNVNEADKGEKINISTTFELLPFDDYLINDVILYNKINEYDEYTSASMIQEGEHYKYTIDAPSHETTILYYIRAKDSYNCINRTSVFEIGVGHESPVIDHIPLSKANTRSYTLIEANIFDESPISSACLYYRSTDQANFTCVEMQADGNIYTAEIPALVTPGTMQYYISATDIYGNENSTDVHEIEVSQPGSASQSTGLLPGMGMNASIAILAMIGIIGAVGAFFVVKKKTDEK